MEHRSEQRGLPDLLGRAIEQASQSLHTDVLALEEFLNPRQNVPDMLEPGLMRQVTSQLGATMRRSRHEGLAAPTQSQSHFRVVGNDISLEHDPITKPNTPVSERLQHESRRLIGRFVVIDRQAPHRPAALPTPVDPSPHRCHRHTNPGQP